MRHLSNESCTKIAYFISTFRGVITWADVIDLAEEVTGERYTRQTLEKRDDIRIAYDLVRKGSEKDAGGRDSSKRKSKELLALEDRILRLTKENDLLKTTNALLREQFVVWATNAQNRGLTEDDLNRPLPPLYRKSRSED